MGLSKIIIFILMDQQTIISLKRLLNKAVFMYNTGKPHKALGKLTPNKFRTTIDNENNSSSYLPLSTVNQY